MSVSEDKYVELMRDILLAEPYRGVCTEPTRLLDHVYIGSQSNAESLRLLRHLRITHVLNCAGYKGPRPTPNASPYEGLGIDYYEFQAEDTDSYDICRHFPEAFRYLDQAKRHGGTVLVHCALGINRSAAVCLGYMMTHSKMPLLGATKILKSKRRIALANRGFQRQMVRFARSRGLLDDLEPEKNGPAEEEGGGGSSWSGGDRIAVLLRSARSDLLGGGSTRNNSHRLLSTDSSSSLRLLPPRYQVAPPRRTSADGLLLSTVTSPRSSYSSSNDDARWRDRRIGRQTINDSSSISPADDYFRRSSGRSSRTTADRQQQQTTTTRERRAQSSPRTTSNALSRPISPTISDRRFGSESYSRRSRAFDFRY